ncbi:MAG: ribonuclease P protein component [Longimicrobiales bacterium]
MQSLTKRNDFDVLFATGTRRRSGDLTVVRAPVGAGSMTKVAVIAGKRVGNAVQRNRAKRRVREALRRVGLPTGEHIAVMAGPRTGTADFPVLVEWVRGGLHADA